MMATKRNGSFNWPAAVERTSPLKALSHPLEKPRGALSFLTWPFVLSQIFLVEQLLGGFMRSAVAENPAETGTLDSTERSVGGDAEAWDAPQAQIDASTFGEPEAVAVSFDDSIRGAAPQATAPVASEHDDTYATDSTGSSIIAEANGAPGDGADAEMAGSPTNFDSADADAPGFGHDSDYGQDAVSGTVLLEIGQTSGAVTGMVDGVTGATEPVLLASSTALNGTTDIAGALIDETVETAEQLVESGVSALNPVTEGVAGITGDALATAESVADAAIAAPAAVVDAATDVVAEAAELTAPVVESVQPVVAVAANTVGATVERVLETGGSSETASVEIGAGSVKATSPTLSAQIDLGEDATGERDGDFLGSDGVIAFNDTPPSPIATDDLFVGGRYTDYGVTLKTDTAVNAGAADQTSKPASAESSAADAQNGELGDADGDTLHGGSTPALADLSEALDEVGLRSSDGLI